LKNFELAKGSHLNKMKLPLKSIEKYLEQNFCEETLKFIQEKDENISNETIE
jgi:hypothetical protein